MSDLQSFLDNALKNVDIGKPKESFVPDEYDVYAEIAEMLITTRTELEITQGELAKITGVSQANISKFENGNSHPSIATLKKIADGLGKRLVVTFVDGEDVD